MSWIDLPHTAGCIVCGRDNPHSLGVQNRVNTSTGVVSVDFVPRAEHIGFQGVIHGGVLATILDEAMVWAATWAGKKFCVCGDMSVRFRHSAAVGQSLLITARIERYRSKLIQTTGDVHSGETLLATATGKYVPVTPERHHEFVGTLIEDRSSSEAAEALARGGVR
jgi:acyl-coenzyme A thioesterase PaaI-like protein